MRNIAKKLIRLPANLSIMLINIYQYLLSPDHSWLKARFPYGYCRHYPSCSQYTKEALGKHGFIKGVLLGSKRVLKCNPWSKPSIDLIPN
jgi:putative membrane protein insertion efficiency factor